MPSRLCQGPATGDPPCPGGELVTAQRGSKQAPRCPHCKAEHERRRGTRQQRGYDQAHVDLRAALLAVYHPSDPCARCGQPLGPNPELLDLGHTDDRRGYRGLEHAACNRGNR